MNIDRFREKVRKRNLEVLARSRQGESHRSLANRFDLSRSRIDLIIHEFKEKSELTGRRNRLFEAIRLSNKLEKAWPAPELVDALDVIPMARTALKNHFKEQNIKEISLRNLMDMVTPPADENDCRQSDVPLLRVWFIGKKGFWSVVNRLSSLDLGVCFKEEWQLRLLKLRREWKITGRLPYS